MSETDAQKFTVKCRVCGEEFERVYKLVEHVAEKHNKRTYPHPHPDTEKES